MAIRVLDKHTAELIAAGEVVERPSSVIKELLENAIDAGATSVRVSIERGGTTFMQVEDNGTGIDAQDIPTAFLRHATSKVRTEADLESIVTLGFRGEALASICSVARVELLTKTESDEFASLYTIHGGEEQALQPAARGIGTTITVTDLFYNTPARMKFLKKDVTEGGYVTENVTRIALSHPEVAISFQRDNKQIFSTPGDGKLESAAWAVLGKDFARELVAVDTTTKNYRAHGLVTKPSGARASRSMQFFFINGRFVKNRTMMAALEQAYRGMLMVGRFPGCVLFLDMPPALVDVNVHPAKTEVRFAFEKEVFAAIYAGVKNTLTEASAGHRQFHMDNKQAGVNDAATGQPSSATQSQFKAPQATVQTAFTVPQQPVVETPRPNTDTAREIAAYNTMVDTLASEPTLAPYQTRQAPPPAAQPQHEWALDIEPQTSFTAPVKPQNTTLDPETLCLSETEKNAYTGNGAVVENASQSSALPKADTTQPQAGLAAQVGADAAPLRLLGEVFKTYILAEHHNTLCVIDKHAAHERIIYEQLVATHGSTDAQQLLAPVSISLSAAEKDALLQNGEALQAAGIEVEDFGGNEVMVRGVPADVQPDNVTDLVLEVANRLAVNGKDNLNEKTEWVLQSVSCRAAIKAGDHTAPEELLRLATAILEGEVPPFCPHGRPIVLEISRKELEKQFGRLG